MKKKLLSLAKIALQSNVRVSAEHIKTLYPEGTAPAIQTINNVLVKACFDNTIKNCTFVSLNQSPLFFKTKNTVSNAQMREFLKENLGDYAKLTFLTKAGKKRTISGTIDTFENSSGNILVLTFDDGYKTITPQRLTKVISNGIQLKLKNIK